MSGNNVVNLLLPRIGSFSDPNPWHQVTYFTGSHDQIYGGQKDSGVYFTQRFGGRGNGWAWAKARLAWALNATLPGTPMMFMGTEGHFDGYWDPVVQSASGYDHRLTGDRWAIQSGRQCSRWCEDINQRPLEPRRTAVAGRIRHAYRLAKSGDCV